MSKKIKVDEFVTHTLPFEKINEAFELMHAGKRWVLLQLLQTFDECNFMHLCQERNFIVFKRTRVQLIQYEIAAGQRLPGGGWVIAIFWLPFWPFILLLPSPTH